MKDFGYKSENGTMKNFKYLGTETTRFSIMHLGHPLEITLTPGKEMMLPEMNKRVISMVVQGLIKQVGPGTASADLELNTRTNYAEKIASGIPESEIPAHEKPGYEGDISEFTAEVIGEGIKKPLPEIKLSGNETSAEIEKLAEPVAEVVTEPVAEVVTEETDEKTQDHTVTEFDLIENPDLALQGVKVGDVIQVPVEETIFDLTAGAKAGKESDKKEDKKSGKKKNETKK